MHGTSIKKLKSMNKKNLKQLCIVAPDLQSHLIQHTVGGHKMLTELSLSYDMCACNPT